MSKNEEILIYRVFHDFRAQLQEAISQVPVIKKVHINMCPTLDSHGVMTV
jgi:exonuclease I